MSCLHKNWTVKAINQVGCGTCLDCGAEVYLPDLFNQLHDRMESMMKRIEARTEADMILRQTIQGDRKMANEQQTDIEYELRTAPYGGIVDIGKSERHLIRVPGGYIYETWTDVNALACCFVPWPEK